MAWWGRACCEQRKKADRGWNKKENKETLSWGTCALEKRYLVSGKNVRWLPGSQRRKLKGRGGKEMEEEASQLQSQKEEAFPSHYLAALRKQTWQELKRGNRRSPQHWRGLAGRWWLISTNFMPNGTWVCVFLRRGSTAFRFLTS